jgi:hypothetical protein
MISSYAQKPMAAKPAPFGVGVGVNADALPRRGERRRLDGASREQTSPS